MYSGFRSLKFSTYEVCTFFSGINAKLDDPVILDFINSVLKNDNVF
jgi:hypothetical protein